MPHGIALHWSWKAGVQIDIAPGVSVFYKGNGYAHGSVSPQECVTPTLRVAAASLKQVKIGTPKWTGLRCLVPVEGADEGMTLDLWAPESKGQSLQAGPKGPVPINSAGPTRLFARDDGAVGELVVLDAGGIVVARKLVEIPQ
jgi:hypothetical protein